MDNYAEYMIRHHKTAADKVKSALYVLAALVLSAVFAYLPILLHSQITVMVCLLCVVAVWYGCWTLLRRQNVEYEYVFVNGELDVDVIYAKSTRKNLVSVRMRDITFCARRDDERFDRQYSNVPAHLYLISAVSEAPGAKVYYVDFMYNAEHTRLLFEPSDEILEMMKKYNPKNIHTPEEEN